MGTEFQKVLCDEHGIGGDGEYCGDDNGAQLDRIGVFYYEAGQNLVDNTPVQNWAKDYRRTDTNASDPPLQKRQAPVFLTSSPAL
jgi:hypothetical protein